MDNEDIIIDLNNQIDRLKDDLLELLFQINYSKEKEMHEFIVSLYEGVLGELANKKSDLTKKDILLNLKNSILTFSEDYKINLS